MKALRHLSQLFAMLLLFSCTREITVERKTDHYPPIFPDYTDVTYPPNMVAPCFALPDSCGAARVSAIFRSADVETVVEGHSAQISIGRREWEKLTHASHSVSVCLRAQRNGRWEEYKPFHIYIADETIDPYIVYRLIEPGYETWNEMGIYQRNLESYTETAIVTNKTTGYGCMNCHSFCMQDPAHMLLHLRSDYAGTYLVENGEVEKINAKLPHNASSLVYPAWHPSGRFVAFSVNDTKQLFHTTDRNRIEVMDYASDVLVYDVEQKQILLTPLTTSETSFETFPAFSPDGATLYFCSSDSVSMPDGYNRAKYSLCSIGFDADSRSFGSRVDTLYDAHKSGGSVSFPRISPDGRFLMFTLSEYGNFSIWHKDADLYLVDLMSGKTRPLTALNSSDVESYHSWSSNSRWTVFGSRRTDGLYTRPFIAYIDSDGNPRKPFLLPQKDKSHYDLLMKSYNIPEFATGRVSLPAHKLLQASNR